MEVLTEILNTHSVDDRRHLKLKRGLAQERWTAGTLEQGQAIGRTALAVMAARLQDNDWLALNRPTIADVAGGAAIFLLVLLVSSFITHSISRQVRKSAVSAVDRFICLTNGVGAIENALAGSPIHITKLKGLAKLLLSCDETLKPDAPKAAIIQPSESEI